MTDLPNMPKAKCPKVIFTSKRCHIQYVRGEKWFPFLAFLVQKLIFNSLEQQLKALSGVKNEFWDTLSKKKDQSWPRKVLDFDP